MRIYSLVLLGICLAAVQPAEGDVSLPAFFSDHAVLQKSDNVPVWGNASPGEAITITIDKATATATADGEGRWRARLNLQAEGPGPFNLVVQGKNTLTLSDVVIGEVWVCGGQSNMQFTLSSAANAKEEIAASANSELRQFKVDYKASAVPLDSDAVRGSWVVADPKTSGAFTAVGYFFGKQLQKTLHVPVGLLNDNWGGTCIEAWISNQGFDPDQALKAEAQKADQDRKAYDDFAVQYESWQKQSDRQDHPRADSQAFAAPNLATSDWKHIILPGLFSAASLPDAGAVWLRKTVAVTPEMVGKNIVIHLGDVRDYAQVYWDGKNIGPTDPSSADKIYTLYASAHVPAGDHILAVRIFNPSAGAGIVPVVPTPGVKTNFSVNNIPLAGDWLAKAEFDLPSLDDAAKGSLPQRPANVPMNPQNVASFDFNGMIHPILPYAIRGVIWYQGEANWNHGYEYRKAFPLLIKDWRARWGRGDFPFYFCQIASYSGAPKIPGNAWFPEVREAQTMTLSLPNTGEAILIDIGEDGNIHPADKLDVGDRLARLALANTYGRKDVVFSGPVYDTMTVENDKIRLHFLHVDGGLVAKELPATYRPISRDPTTVPLARNSPNSQLEGFAICGDDHLWKWANAKIDGDSVVVSSPDVPKPVAVRYAWANYPYCNLYNGAGLPAGPFRTDDFPLLSLKLHY
jgi:sialate O-acetylesterase